MSGAGPALALIKARAIGLMTMIDSGASDDKVIAVATNDPNSTATSRATSFRHTDCSF